MKRSHFGRLAVAAAMLTIGGQKTIKVSAEEITRPLPVYIPKPKNKRNNADPNSRECQRRAKQLAKIAAKQA
jgi:hypothetical protein